MQNINDSIINLPTTGNGIKLTIENNYWQNLDIYKHGQEYLFSLKGENGADKIIFYKHFNNGLNKTRKFISKFK